VRSYTFALLQDKNSGAKILAVNTHIDYISAANVLQIERIIELTEKDFSCVPKFYTGDWNMRRTSDGYKVLEKAGYIATEEMVAGAKKDGTCVSGEDKTIDFCFVDKNTVKGIAYHVINDHEYAKTASDHYAVYTEIELI
jgi:endonuclease/exonuclease/phosphatase family metal-dependent hydrolase